MITNDMLSYTAKKRIALSKIRRHQLINFSISQGSYAVFLDNIVSLIHQNVSAYVCVANVHMFVESHFSPLFAEVINNAQIVTPDGLPLTWGLSLLYGIRQNRVAGMDLLPNLIHIADKEQLPVFVYGGTENMQQKAKSFFAAEYPDLDVRGMYSPPFRELTKSEDAEVISMINASGARIVLVCLGCPKQEKWMNAMQGKINAVMLGIGGALPVLVGLKKRAPQWMQTKGLEWFFRLCQEPKRLFWRYAYTNSIFIFLIMREWLSIKLLGKKKHRSFAPYRNN